MDPLAALPDPAAKAVAAGRVEFIATKVCSDAPSWALLSHLLVLPATLLHANIQEHEAQFVLPNFWHDRCAPMFRCKTRL